MAVVKIGFIGGTGPEGKGLAYRFALAGHDIVIGSRSRERADAAAKEIAERVPDAIVRGVENVDAARDAEAVIITVPFSAQAETLSPLQDTIGDKIVVSSAVPLSFNGGKPSMLIVPEGSAAQQAQSLLPRATVVSAFQNLGAAKLWQGDEPLDQDVIVCGDNPEVKQRMMTLAGSIRGARVVDGGPLAASHYVEGITVLLIGVNKRYKATTGVHLVGLP